MGLKVMRWPLRPGSKKYQVNLVLHKLEGLALSGETIDETRLILKLRWKGGARGALGSRFGVKRGHTRPALLGGSGAVEWEEEFENICAFTMTKEGAFMSWPVTFVLCKAVTSALRAKPLIIGTVLVDLVALMGNVTQVGTFKKIPIVCNIGGSEVLASLSMSVSFIELRTGFDGLESVHRLMAPAIACMGEPMWDSDDQKPMAMRKKGRSLRGFSLKGSKKAAAAPLEGEVFTDHECKLAPARSSAGKSSPCSDGSLPDSGDQFDTDSPEDSDEEEYVEPGMLQKSFSYGTLAGANLVAGEVISFHRDGTVDPDAGDIMTVHSRASSGFPKTAPEEPTPIETDLPTTQPSPLSMKSMLSWRKRKLSFRSPRSRGEPLLNKAYGEEGGDEIDWDRRQSDAVSPAEKLLLIKYHSGESLCSTSSTETEVLDFGDELFTVGSWEKKDLVSRDGQIKLSANVFFASFDQRSESAAGESACTALVAVIADWLHTHPGLMPSKAEFDMLIRDGSAEWRKLCEVDTYRDRFPDRHFDLETVLEAGVRPLTVSPDKSFVGFFQPETVEELGESYDFLKHVMTFDEIWDEIERCGPAVYIVSWNDHFFVLRVEEKCCYIIDTLGERLYEGCNQAYILHFDETTTLCNVPLKPAKDAKDSKDSKDIKDAKDPKDTKDTKDAKVVAAPATTGPEVSVSSDKTEKRKLPEAEASALEIVLVATGTEVSVGDTVYGGKGACRQFVKRFFAAIQLREVELNAKKGAAGKITQTSLYQKLQIEFHYAKAMESFLTSSTLGLSL